MGPAPLCLLQTQDIMIPAESLYNLGTLSPQSQHHARLSMTYPHVGLSVDAASTARMSVIIAIAQIRQLHIFLQLGLFPPWLFVF